MKRKGILMLVLLFLLVGCRSGRPDSPSVGETESDHTRENDPKEVIELSIASAANFDNVTGRALQECVDQLEEESGGRIHIELYGSSALGDDDLLIQALQKGTVSIVLMDVSLHNAVVPEAALESIPLTFNSLDEYNALMNGEYGEIFQSYYEDKGLHLVANYSGNWKYLSSSVPVETESDIRNLNMRVIDSDFWQLYWKSCGANVGTANFSDLYMALKEGQFQAQENSLEAIYINKLYEVQNYLIETKHSMSTEAFVMNLEQYEALPDDVKEALEECFHSFILRFYEETKKMQSQQLNEMIQTGIELQPASPALRQAMLAAREPMIEKLKQEIGSEKVDQYLEAVSRIQKKN